MVRSRALRASVAATLFLASLISPIYAQSEAMGPPCATSSLVVSTGTSNTALSRCAATLIVYNVTNQEVFVKISNSASVTATLNDQSIPGGYFFRYTLATNQQQYIAAIVAANSTTLRLTTGLMR
jgi:hypothetical protein